MNPTLRSLNSLKSITALIVTCAAMNAGAGTIIGHVEASATPTLPMATMNAIGQQKWLFTHASVGGNMIDGMQALHDSDASRYPLVMETSGDWNSIFDPPATTAPGTIYDAPRGNPGWETKFAMFDQAVRTQGWHAPKIGIAMDKLCFIDQDANPTNYITSMTALERDHPGTVFVYTTMPLESGPDADWSNILRTDYNNAVRSHCQSGNHVLFDIADIESHDPSGNPVTFTNEGRIYQRMYAGYTDDGGHLDATGQQRVALGWYATAAALVTSIQWTTNTLPSGLIAWWQGEGDMLDSVGTHHGGGSATPTYASGRYGQAFQFNGTDQSVSIPDIHADLDSWTQFTLEAWVNFDQTADIPGSPGPGRCILSKVGGPAGNFGYQFGFYNNARRFFVQFNTNGQAWASYSATASFPDPMPTNTWLHAAATYDRDTIKLYLNGMLVKTNQIGPVTLANSPSTLRISKDDNMNVPFTGRIDDARIYNRALTATEISRLALGLPGANGFWGIKTHDPLSQAPTTMFWFDENGANYRELPRVTLSGTEIEADGLAMSPKGELFAFQVNTSGGSRLLWLNPTNAVATVIGSVLAGRDIRGAVFTLSGRLLAFDCAAHALIEVDPSTGLQTGAAVPLSPDIGFTTTAGDLTQMPDGSLVFAYHDSLYALDARTGSLSLLFQDKSPLPDGNIPFCCGIACVPGSDPASKLYCYEASQDDSVYQYLPSSNYTRLLLYNDVVPGYNAGRGDLAALPGGVVELQSFDVNGTNAAISAVCRAGVHAQIEYSDNLGTTNWQTVPGTPGWVPQTPGSIATPMTWTNLPAGVSNRFFRVKTMD